MIRPSVEFLKIIVKRKIAQLMPLIRNTVREPLDYETADVIQQILQEDGSLPVPPELNSVAQEKEHFNQKADRLRNTLDRAGATVENTASVLADIMNDPGESSATRLRAVEKVLDLHGLTNSDGQVNKVPTFQFFIQDNRVNVNQIFAPHAQRRIDEMDAIETTAISEIPL